MSTLLKYSYRFYIFQLVIEKTEIPIKSIDLQLVRVETCGCAEGYARDGKYRRKISVSFSFKRKKVLKTQNKFFEITNAQR